MRRHASVILKASRLAFRRRETVIAAVAAVLAVVLAAMAAPNVKLLVFILTEPEFDAALKLKAAVRAVWSGRLAFAKASGPLVAAVALLFGWNVGLLAHRLKDKIREERAAGAGLAGMVIGLFGVGCAACGSVLLTTLFGAGAAAAVVGALPFKGAEFGVVGIAVILGSIHHVSKRIVDPDACAIPKKR